MATSFIYVYVMPYIVMATSFFYINVMATSLFYIYVMATSFFYIYVMATSFFYIYVKALTFTLHLLNDGAASRSIERHFFICITFMTN